MIAIDPRLPKMVYSSVLTTIKERLTTALSFAPVPKRIYMEGDDRTDISKQSELIEVRLAGPDFYNPSDDNYEVALMVNFEIRVAKGDLAKYRIHELGGYCLAAIAPLPVMNNDAVTPAKIFCLDPKSSPARPIKYHSFGEIEPKLEMLQAGVFASFCKQVNMREIAATL